MKRRHVTGTKRERKGSGDWYASIASTHIAQVEAQWATQPHTPRAYAAMALACGRTLELSNATQAELDALVRDYLTHTAALGQN